RRACSPPSGVRPASDVGSVGSVTRMGSSAASQQEASADHFAIHIRRCAEPTDTALSEGMDDRPSPRHLPEEAVWTHAWLATSAAVASCLALGSSASEAFSSSLAPTKPRDWCLAPC